jgi:hypothetical protein
MVAVTSPRKTARQLALYDRYNQTSFWRSLVIEVLIYQAQVVALVTLWPILYQHDLLLNYDREADYIGVLKE